MDMTELGQVDPAIAQALPQGQFLMTAAADGIRSGFITRWVQQCSQVPLLVSVAIPRGTIIEPLLRDSRRFAICSIRPDDRVVRRRFSDAPGRQEDPYVGLRCFTDVTGAPILHRSRFYLDCELVGHLAMESDCRIYIGQVLSGKALEPLELVNGHANGHVNGNGHAHDNGYTNGSSDRVNPDH